MLDSYYWLARTNLRLNSTFHSSAVDGNLSISDNEDEGVSKFKPRARKPRVTSQYTWLDMGNERGPGDTPRVHPATARGPRTDNTFLSDKTYEGGKQSKVAEPAHLPSTNERTVCYNGDDQNSMIQGSSKVAKLPLSSVFRRHIYIPTPGHFLVSLPLLTEVT